MVFCIYFEINGMVLGQLTKYVYSTAQFRNLAVIYIVNNVINRVLLHACTLFLLKNKIFSRKKMAILCFSFDKHSKYKL